MNKQININHILWTCYPTNKKEYINKNSLEKFESLKENKKKDNKMIQKKDSKIIQKKVSKKKSYTNFSKITDMEPVAKAKIIVKTSTSQFKERVGEKNKNWQFSKPNIKNKLAIPPIAVKKEPTDPIDNPNVKNQKVVPRSIVKNINVKYDSLDGTPLKSDTIIIGKNVFNVVELGDFDPLAFYNLGAVVTSDGNRYINLITSRGTGSNNPISDTYAWAPFNYA